MRCTRPYGLTALLALVCGLAAGCGVGAPAKPDNRRRAAEAIDALRDAGTASVDLTIKLPANPNGVEITGKQRRRYAGQPASDTTFTVRGTGFVDWNVDGAEVITLGDTVYRKGFSRQRGKAWERFEPGGTPTGQPSSPSDRRSAVPDPTMSTAALFDPVSYLRLADEGSADGDTDFVTDGGNEVINGTPTHRYHVGCPFEPEPASACHLRNLGPVAAMLPTRGTLFIDYWLDRESRPRKLMVHGLLDDNQASQPGVMVDVTMTLDTFGVPVDIAPPPAADTATCRQAGADLRCGGPGR